MATLNFNDLTQNRSLTFELKHIACIKKNDGVNLNVSLLTFLLMCRVHTHVTHTVHSVTHMKV